MSLLGLLLCARRFLDRADQDNAKVQEVLRLFLQKLNFKGASLDEALRSMVVRFRLPGEAQQMDRFVLWYVFHDIVYTYVRTRDISMQR